MKLINKKINGLKILKTKIYVDKRGHFKEVYKKKSLKIQILYSIVCLLQKKMY